MKVKPADLTGPALDWAVASIEALPKDRLHLFYGKPAIDRECLGLIDTLRCEFSTNWTQGGPIIEREGIEVVRGNDLIFPKGNEKGEYSEPLWLSSYRGGRMFHGPTPLIAAMRCFCCAKLGDEIEIPQELQLCQQPNL